MSELKCYCGAPLEYEGIAAGALSRYALYRCVACGKGYEVVEKEDPAPFSFDKKQICPACNGMGVIKKLSHHESTATYSEITTCHKCGGEGWIDKEVGLIYQTLTGGKNE